MILYDTKYLQLKSTKFGDSEWYYAHRPNVTGVVVVLPIISNKQILFLIERRPPLISESVCEYSIGFPAGLVGDERTGETIEEAIKSELLEEAGLIAEEVKIVSNKVLSSPGCVSEYVTIAIAKINEYNIVADPIDDNGIITDRVLVDIDSVHNWLTEKEGKGYGINASALGALYYFFREKV